MWKEIQGPLGLNGQHQGWTEGKRCLNIPVLFLDPCPTFKTHACACVHTHTHIHTHTHTETHPLQAFCPVPDSFPEEI